MGLEFFSPVGIGVCALYLLMPIPVREKEESTKQYLHSDGRGITAPSFSS